VSTPSMTGICRRGWERRTSPHHQHRNHGRTSPGALLEFGGRPATGRCAGCCARRRSSGVLGGDSLPSTSAGRNVAHPGPAQSRGRRDRGCAYPGCDRTPRWCQVITSQCGRSRRVKHFNLVMLCRTHHVMVHQIRLAIRMPAATPNSSPGNGSLRLKHPPKPPTPRV